MADFINKNLFLKLLQCTKFIFSLLFLSGNIGLIFYIANQIDHDTIGNLVWFAKWIVYNGNHELDYYGEKAFSKIKTDDCRNRLLDLIGQINYGKYNFFVDNNCTTYFDKAQYGIYKGCYKDTLENRILRDFHYNFTQENTQNFCVQACLRAGFLFSGLERGSNCYCGDDPFPIEGYSHLKLDDESCQTHLCPGENNLYCGGNDAISLYSTGIKKNKLTRGANVTPINLSSTNRSDKLESSIKILFVLQLNGRNSRQINRLLKIIYRPDHLYYVHVDKQQDFLYQEMRNVQIAIEGTGLRNFYVSSDRLNTIWGGTSLLNVFLTVISKTLKHSVWSRWDYIINLSETDLPVLRVELLEIFLRRNRGFSFLSSNGYNNAKFLKKQGFFFHFLECEQRMWRVAIRNKFPQNLQLDGGSDWVIIHRDLAEFAASDSKLATELIRFFTTVLLPLESFFHTLALNSHFCDRIVYKNLRLTNWNRKQGCRCSTLASVDWCGCSPMAFQIEDYYKLVNNNNKTDGILNFFARKFDSLIDIGLIGLIEQHTLPLSYSSSQMFKRIYSSINYNSTWINVFNYYTDAYSSGNINIGKYIQEEFARSLLFSVQNKIPVLQKCNFVQLLEIFAFKKDVMSKVQTGVVIEIDCDIDNITIQFLIEQNFPSKLLASNANENLFTLSAPIVGLNFDHKEEIFRTFPPLIDTTDSMVGTIVWKFKSTGGKDQIKTSPSVQLRIFDPRGEFTNFDVNAYDSINGIQFFDLKMQSFQHPKPGRWRAIINSSGTLGEVEFPVFPSFSNQNAPEYRKSRQIADKLVSEYFLVSGMCTNAKRETEGIDNCISSYWSSIYPDPKSEIRFGYDYDLGVLL